MEFTDFNFDGDSVEVGIYGAADGNYAAGFEMSKDLLRDTSYEGETIEARLPAERTLDDLGGVSVWCAPVGASFGSGEFSAPE